MATHLGVAHHARLTGDEAMERKGSIRNATFLSLVEMANGTDHIRKQPKQREPKLHLENKWLQGTNMDEPRAFPAAEPNRLKSTAHLPA